MTDDDRQEDRGTAFYVWTGPDQHSSFCRFPGATAIHFISVPIGWEPRPDRFRGIVLQSTFGRRVDAEEALSMALGGQDGFGSQAGAAPS